MGITHDSLARLYRHLKEKDKIFMIGCQNLYISQAYGHIAHDHFSLLGHDIRTIDITGCQGSEVADLREDLHLQPEYDIVADFGSKEHVDGPLYQPFKNIHEACKVGGFMIHENPMRGHWPGHGQHYFTMDFYHHLASHCQYDVLELVTEPAMGNSETGMNVCSVLRKVKDIPFMSNSAFNKIYKSNVYDK